VGVGGIGDGGGTGEAVAAGALYIGASETGAGVVGVTTVIGGEGVGAIGPSVICISAQFQNCSCTPRPS